MLHSYTPPVFWPDDNVALGAPTMILKVEGERERGQLIKWAGLVENEDN